MPKQLLKVLQMVPPEDRTRLVLAFFAMLCEMKGRSPEYIVREYPELQGRENSDSVRPALT